MINHRANEAGSQAAARTLGLNSVPPARWSASFKGPVQTSSTRTAAMTKLAFKGNDVMPGGKADKLPESSFDRRALAQGTKVEREHVKSKRMAKEIASDHITEFPNYYPELKKLEKRLEKKAADWRRALTRGVNPEHVDPAETRRILDLAQPGDIALSDFRLPLDWKRALKNPTRTWSRVRPYLAGESPTHVKLIVDPQDSHGALGFAPPQPEGPGMVDEELAGPMLIVRPRDVTRAQGVAAAESAITDFERYIRGKLPYEYSTQLYKDMAKGAVPPLLANRLSDIPGVGGPLGNLARRISNRGLQACDPASETCGSYVIRHWSNENALGPGAMEMFTGAKGTPAELQKYYASPGRIGLSPHVDLVGANFPL